jgi:hypothetical protein
MAREIKRCKSRKCNMRVLWVRDIEGNKIPLDPEPKVYHVGADMTGAEVATLVDNFYVSHWATCKDPQAFIGPKEGRKV